MGFHVLVTVVRAQNYSLSGLKRSVSHKIRDSELHGGKKQMKNGDRTDDLGSAYEVMAPMHFR